MSAKINSNYLGNYATEFTHIVCQNYFTSNKYMTGQAIIQLTQSPQVNFFVLKALFEAWQTELEKLKSNPYFDYRNNTVHNALRDFMNVLSRSIKIEKEDFEPLLGEAVAYSILLAVDPLRYYSAELDKVPADQINGYLKENKKYFKWHNSLITNLIDRAGLGHTHEAYKKALRANYEEKKNELEPADQLLKSLQEILPLDLKKLLDEGQEVQAPSENIAPAEAPSAAARADVRSEEVSSKEEPKKTHQAYAEKIAEPIEEEVTVDSGSVNRQVAKGSKAIDPLRTWERFESEEYTIMKGTIGKLSESVGINQRFMFTKELFDGNPDLLKHALKSIDQCESFADAIRLLNERFVAELNWNKESEAVDEFLQLIFRKFDQKT